MSKAAYSGNSPQKSKVRSAAYANINRKALYGKSHVVIASRDCGDIKLLLACGVKPSMIVACDIDTTARKNAEKLGVVVSPFATITETVKWCYETDRKLASINCDLCGTLATGFNIFKDICDLVDIYKDYKVVIFYTFLRARDSDFLFRNVREALIAAPYDDQRKEIVSNARTIVEWQEYQSWTEKNNGSPMVMVTV